MNEYSHRRRVDENGDTLHERRTDTDAWARLDAWATRYKIAWGFWLILVGVGSWVGSRVVRPLDQVPVIAAGHREIMSRLDSGDQDRAVLQNILLVLVRVQCLQMGRIDRAKLNLDCRDIPFPQ